MRSSRGAAVACLLVTAGCLAGTGLTEPAMTNVELAREAAARWVPDPVLVAVMGEEPPHEIRNAYYEAVQHADAAPGDGLVPAWTYLFVGSDGRASGIFVVSGVGVLGEGRTANESDDLDRVTPIANWTVDSDRAAQTLAVDARWPGPRANLSVAWSLAMHRGAPQWNVSASWDDRYPRYAARINAQTGELLYLAREPDPFVAMERKFERMEVNATMGARVGEEWDCDADTAHDGGLVTPLEGVNASATLEERGHAFVNVTLDGAGPVRLVVEHGGVRVREEIVGPAIWGELTYDLRLDDLGAGEVAASLFADASVALDAWVRVTAVWGPGRGGCPPDIG